MTDKYGFSSPYASWSEAKKNATGYEAESIFEKVKAAHLKVKNGEVAYTRDTALFDKIEYSWPLLSGLLWVASRSNNRLNLIDFGGALGTSYYQNRSFLSHLDLFKWNIVEQEKFVKCGKDLFEDQHLQFYFNIQDCVKECNPNVILLSGVLQYIEKPYELLQLIFDLQFEYILFDRTAFSASGSECLSVRRIPLRSMMQALFGGFLMKISL